MKQFTLLAVAGLLFVGAGTLSAQTKQCSGEAKGKACCAAKATKGAEISSIKDVTRDELAQMLKARNVVVVDARGDEQFTQGHIEGALNYEKAELPTDKSAALVFYCGGLKCPAASKAAKKALESGYTNVMVFKGGWAEWRKQS